ncbi:MAG: extracellular solute-binding protein [Anaerolineae bacterium]|nr:extracellular solute-binding protein [Anaerolineae bacterium]
METPKTKLSRRQFLKNAALAAGGLAVAAKAGNAFAASSAFARRSTRFRQQLSPITIQINESPWFAGFEALVNYYQETTGNTVNLSVLPFNGMLDKSRNAVQAAESEFDILNLNEQWYMPFYAGGLVMPLEEIEPGFTLDPQIIEYDYATRWDESINYSGPNGVLYGLPINGNIQLYYYRKDLLEENGLSVPTTWAELEAVAQALHNPPNMHGFTLRTKPPNFEFQAYLASHGASIVELDTETGEWSIGLAKPEAVAALNTWLNLGKTYGPANLVDMGQAENQALMQSGRLAQIHAVTAMAPNLQNPDNSVVVDKVGASIVPGTGDLRYTMSGIWVMSIPRNVPAERQTAALEFLKWALTNENQVYYTQAGAIPVRQDTYEQLADDPKVGWWAKAMAESTPFIRAQPRLVETAQLVEIIDRRVVQALIGELSPEDAMMEAAKEVETILENGDYKYKPL